ncbi:MAG: transglycosylase SLT domain-containing protein [Cellvibrionaceae bacterium]
MLSLSKFAVITGLFVSVACHAGALPQPKIYKFVDAEGRVSYTDRPAHDGYVKLEKTWKGWVDPGQTFAYRENKRKYQDLIVSAAKEYDVPFWLISAVIHAESLYNPQARSSAGAIGLMQLMPGTAKRYGVWNRQDPAQNIDGGVRYLKDLLVMFDGDLTLALAGYNAGENAVKKYGNRVPPYNETQHYVRKVSDLSQKYKSQSI